MCAIQLSKIPKLGWISIFIVMKGYSNLNAAVKVKSELLMNAYRQFKNQANNLYMKHCHVNMYADDNVCVQFYCAYCINGDLSNLKS